MSHKWRLWWRSVRKARLDVKSVPDGGGLLEGVHHGDPPDIPGPPLPALRLCPRRPGPADAAAEAEWGRRRRGCTTDRRLAAPTLRSSIGLGHAS